MDEVWAVVLVVVLAVDYVEILVPNNHYVMVIVNVILVVPDDDFFVSYPFLCKFIKYYCC